MEPFEKMYSVKEAAAISGWSVDSIRRRCDAGLVKSVELPPLPGKKLNRKYIPRRIPGSEVLKLTRPKK
jgi:hypothetical protein